MKKLFLFITIGLISLTTFAQGIDDYNYNAWQHPIIKQLQAKSDSVIGYGDNNKWINIAILDKTTKMLYWINCTGFVIDKATVSDLAYNKLIKRQLDPFDYHQTLWETGLELIDAAIYKFRFPKTIFKYTGIPDFDKNIEEEYQIPIVKSAKTPLEKLAALYEERRINLFNLARCEAKHPDNVITNTAAVLQIANTQKGIIKVLGNADTAKSVEFYNTDLFSPVYKAILEIPSSKLYFYTQNQVVFDSLNILPKHIPKLINEKTDVFTLYQNLNAWRLTQVDSIGKLLTNYPKTPNKKANIFIQTLLKTYQGNSEELRFSILAAQKKYVTNLNVLNGIDNNYFEQGVKYYLSKENPVTKGQYQANTGTIFTYTISTEQRGNKLYELDDHRGNVMAVISDRKNGVDSNHDGKIDYYEPDVVKVTDYSSFGMPLPGRTFQIKEYDYSFNGKRDDYETGYQNYGQRMYDPNIGRFISVDPITKQYAGLTPYQFAGNTPIQATDLDGKEEYHYTLTLNKNGTSTLRLQSTKYYNEHNLFGFNFKTKIANKRAIVSFNSEKYYIGFAGTYGRGNEDMFSTFNLWKANPDAKAFESLFYSEPESYKGATDKAVEQNREILYSMLSNTFVVNADGSTHMIGSNGTQTPSKTTWQRGKTERIDIENPSPGQRPGQIHYQDENNTKYLYNINENKFYGQNASGEFTQEAKSVNNLLENKNFQKGIDKALKYLGEDSKFEKK
jgi:RHS repeat-associated protein